MLGQSLTESQLLIMVHNMTTTQLISTLTDEQKNKALLDLTEVVFSLATTLRTLEIFAQTSVEYSELTDTPTDFTQVGHMLLDMREDGPLSDRAIDALDHPNVNDNIASQLGSLLKEDYGVDVASMDAADLDVIIEAIETSLKNGDLDLDTLHKYL